MRRGRRARGRARARRARRARREDRARGRGGREHHRETSVRGANGEWRRRRQQNTSEARDVASWRARRSRFLLLATSNARGGDARRARSSGDRPSRLSRGVLAAPRRAVMAPKKREKAAAAPLSAYELEREARVKRNAEILARLRIPTLAAATRDPDASASSSGTSSDDADDDANGGANGGGDDARRRAKKLRKRRRERHRARAEEKAPGRSGSAATNRDRGEPSRRSSRHAAITSRANGKYADAAEDDTDDSDVSFYSSDEDEDADASGSADDDDDDEDEEEEDDDELDADGARRPPTRKRKKPSTKPKPSFAAPTSERARAAAAAARAASRPVGMWRKGGEDAPAFRAPYETGSAAAPGRGRVVPGLGGRVIPPPPPPPRPSAFAAAAANPAMRETPRPAEPDGGDVDLSGKTKKKKNGATRRPTPSLLHAVASEADVHDAWTALQPPSTTVAIERGAMRASDATIGASELRAAADAHGFCDWCVLLTLVPIRPRRRGERRSLRTFAGVSLRPPLAFNPRLRRLSTPTDAFQLQLTDAFQDRRTAGEHGRRRRQRRRRPGHRRRRGRGRARGGEGARARGGFTRVRGERARAAGVSWGVGWGGSSSRREAPTRTDERT